MSRPIYFLFEDQYHKLMDAPLEINIDEQREYTVGYLTSKALEKDDGEFIYNFRCHNDIYALIGIDLFDKNKVVKYKQYIPVKKAYPANTKIISKLVVRK